MPNTISVHLVHFCQHLRREGLGVGPAETMDALRALAAVDIGNEYDFRSALQMVLCSSPDKQKIFDRLYQLYFHSQRRGDKSEGLPVFFEEAKSHEKKEGSNKETEKSEKESEKERFASAHQSPGSFFAAISDDGIEEGKGFSFPVRVSFHHAEHPVMPRISQENEWKMQKSIRRLVQHLQFRANRRWQPAERGSRIDLRRTFRKSLAYGGETLDLARKEKSLREAKFVLLCDGSRSMTGVAEMMLRFAWALTRSTKQAEIFLFSTHLTRITDQLKQVSGRGKPLLKVKGAEWGGGTRIGESLTDFVTTYRRLLNRNTLIVIASDGLDTGAIDELEAAMRTIHRKTAGVVWLNPLLSIPGYRPEAKGMKTALPYIDLFVPVNSIFTCSQWVKVLQKRR